jgi:zinc transporter ZupT
MSHLVLWALLAFCTTLAGAGLLLLKREWSRKNVWRILAFASGALLSVSFIHILPEANLLSPGISAAGVLAAFLLMFIIEGFTMTHSCLEYAENCHVHLVGMTALSALAVHSLFDGVAMAVAFRETTALGHAVSSAVLIHKFTDGLTLTGLLLTANYATRKCLGIVSILAFATPLGALISPLFVSVLSSGAMAGGLGFVAGIFFYIGASDILPRLHKERDVWCLASFAFGLSIGALRSF